MNIKHALFVMALGAAIALPALGGVSPHETITAKIGDNNVKITYGRPFSKKPGTDTVRKIWGGLVPWDKAWRLGSDQSTTLVCDKGIVLGGVTVPAGTYRLYMVPSENGTSKLAINKTTGIWGIQKDGTVDEKNDLARVDLKKDSVDTQVDQLTLSLASGSAPNSGVIGIVWEKTKYSIEFTNAP
jgi:hypothetical protein